MFAVLYISSHKSHYTDIGLDEHNMFSINFPSTNIMDKLVYCGLVSGSTIDKSKIFDTFYKSSNKIPMIDECSINMGCEVLQSFTVFDMEVFIGQVIEVYANEECLLDGFPDTQKVNPMFYSIDNSYWTIGKKLAKASVKIKN